MPKSSPSSSVADSERRPGRGPAADDASAVDEVSSAVVTALRAGDAAICVTGSPTADVTALCRAVSAADERAFVARLTAPGREPDGMLLQLLRDFGLATGEAGEASRPEPEALSAALVRFLRSLIPLHAHAVIVIDDAHRLPRAFSDRLLDIVRAVNRDSRPLRLVLVGTPALLERLRQAPLRDLAAPGSWRHLTLRSPAAAAVAPSRAVPRVAAAAGILIIAAAGIWLSQQNGDAPASGVSRSTSGPATPSAVRPAPDARAAAAPPSADSGAPASAGSPSSTSVKSPAPSSAPLPTGAAASPGGDAPSTYRLTIASFRTAGRAAQIADDLRAGGLPAVTRVDATNTWHQVIAGPFPSLDVAREAQRRFETAGFTDTRISEINPTAPR